MYLIRITNIGSNDPDYPEYKNCNLPTIRILMGNGEIFIPPGSVYEGTIAGVLMIEEATDGRRKS